MKDAHANCKDYSFDLLDMNLSAARQKTFVSFDNGIKILDEKCHYVVLFDAYNNCGEIGFCTLANAIDYFMFIYLEPEELEKIVQKYELKRF